MAEVDIVPTWICIVVWRLITLGIQDTTRSIGRHFMKIVMQPNPLNNDIAARHGVP